MRTLGIGIGIIVWLVLAAAAGLAVLRAVAPYLP